MQCFKCGEEQTEGNVFCTKCGARLSGTHPLVEGPQETSPPPISVSPSAHEEEQKILMELKEALKGVEEEKESPEPPPSVSGGLRKKSWLVGAVVLFLLIAGINLLMIVKKPKTTEPSVPPSSGPASEEIHGSRPVEHPSSVDESTRTTIGKMSAILEGISSYNKNKKSLPPSLTAINRSYADPANIQDGWGQNFIYLVDLTNKTFVLSSDGPDTKRGTADDLSVMGEKVENWTKQNEVVVAEWKSTNPNLYAQLATSSGAIDEAKKLEAARKQEEAKKHAAELKSQAKAQAEVEQERKRREVARVEEEKKLAEAKKREEEQRQAKAREEALKQQMAAKKPEIIKDDFSNGLAQWDAPSTWEIVDEKDVPALRIQGLGFLKRGAAWDNYKVDFDIRVNKESAGWIVRAQNHNSFYLFKLATEKAKAVPKNSLIRYIRSDDKYLNSLKREDAPGAAGVIPLPFKVKTKEYYKISVSVRGHTITHTIDGDSVDAWSDDTFDHGRFGFNASIIEQATIRNFLLEPLR